MFASIVVRVSPLLFIILRAVRWDNWDRKLDLTKSGLTRTLMEAAALSKTTLSCR